MSSLSIPTTHLSFSKTLSSPNPLFFSKPCLSFHAIPRKTTVIRMGGGPRTYPGGVSKWQWKRMQAKKAKQLLKARLCRERQIYEMRKRAELKAAVSELERPWEVMAVERAPTLFSVSADEQVKVLADRFQRAGGFDLWTERDGPQLFETPEGVPSARFFPKGVVHSVKPYGKVSGFGELDNGEVGSGLESELDEGCNRNERLTEEDLDLSAMEDGSDSEGGLVDAMNSGGKLNNDKRTTKRNGSKFIKKLNRRRFGSGLGALDSGQVEFDREKRRESNAFNRSGNDRINKSGSGNRINKSGSYSRINKSGSGNRINKSGSDSRIMTSKASRNSRNSESEVYDMSLQGDGSYGFQVKNRWCGSDYEAGEPFAL